MEIHTAGFSGWTARDFFERLRSVGVDRVIDVRLRNTSQLAGFAKRDDLAYFLERIVGAEYEEEPLLAPTDDLLDAYKKGGLPWQDFLAEFGRLLEARRVEDHLDPARLSGTTLLLCSEHEPDRCHRRIVLEHLGAHWPDVSAVHIT